MAFTTTTRKTGINFAAMRRAKPRLAAAERQAQDAADGLTLDADSDDFFDNVEPRTANVPTPRGTVTTPFLPMLQKAFATPRGPVEDIRVTSEYYKSLKKGQKRAFDAIEEFARDDDRRSYEFLLQGGAGVGKSFLQKAITSDIPVAWCATATTNKAAKVLQRSLGPTTKARTIYSVLGVKMTPKDDSMQLEFPKTPVDISAYDILSVDEAGMLTERMVDYMRIQALRFGVKLLYVGDDAQLNPVGEEVSKVFKVKRRAELKRVLRHDNQILELANHVRAHVKGTATGDLRLRSDNNGREGVWRLKMNKFLSQIEEAAEAGFFSAVDHTKACAWRNDTVDMLNGIVRRRIYGKKEAREKWLPGDRVTIKEPVIDRDDRKKTIAFIDEEGTISSVTNSRHAFYPDIQTLKVVIKMDEGPPITIDIVAERSENRLLDELNRLSREARADPKKWKFFWGMKNSFHNIRHSYALTGHRAQGSTFKNVFADTGDMLANPTREEALRCLYVGVSRPSTRLILA